MIGCNLKGGLCNMMFQIATLEYISKNYNIPITYPNTDINLRDISNAYGNNAIEYKNMFKNFHWNNVYMQNQRTKQFPFEYSEEIKIPIEDIFYDGFFQSEKYFNCDKNFVYNLFEPADFIKEKLNSFKKLFKDKTTCSIHVRRGDYLKYPDIHNTQPIEYYLKGMNIIPVDKYIIFSDDINWCKNYFIGEQFVFIENEKDYVELFLMSVCNHNIISNSSFGWWGAYLNQNIEKKVIGPIKWFENNTYNNKDIIPEAWIQI